MGDRCWFFEGFCHILFPRLEKLAGKPENVENIILISECVQVSVVL